MIASGDMAMNRAPPAQASAEPLRERVLTSVLYVTVLASSVAFIEPSPHDGLMSILAVTCFVAGVRFERTLVIPLLLLVVWNVSGMMALLGVSGEEKTIQYTSTSVYLAIATLLFAGMLAQNTMPRITTLSAAYVLTATIAALCGVVGYFNLFPGAYDLMAPGGRALGLFKDPNVYGPFLIWPALVVLERMVSRQIRFFDFIIAGIILLALLLSYSRGAWFHFGLSGAIMLALTFLSAPTSRARTRIVLLSAIGVVVLAAIVVALLSFDSIGGTFTERAHLINSYDVGDGGRFRLQELALSDLLKFPNGMGPYTFIRVHGNQQHNQYLQAFVVYGWTGGMAYILLVLTTIWIGLRTALVRAPWQPYLIVAFGTFVGEALEGFIIDTDHWRHFFLLLGMIWGLAAATLHQTRAVDTRTPNGPLSRLTIA